MSRIALDSNILIYNHSLDDESKRLIARDFFKEKYTWPLEGYRNHAGTEY